MSHEHNQPKHQASPESTHALSSSGFDGGETGQFMAAPPFQLKAGTAGDPPVQRKGSAGGLGGDLVNGFAASTGHDLSDVNVHRNSSKPSEVGALAYAQGNDIHLGPGQDKHLPHEAAHIVQQREGRVKPTTEVNGMAVNDNQGLESEADRMGESAVQCKMAGDGGSSLQNSGSSVGVVQRVRQPIVQGAAQGTMGISRFIELVELEEAKFPAEEQTNTSLMITRLRKIFYGSEGWDEHLIRGVENIESPYGEPQERERSRRTVELTGPFNDFDLVDNEVYPVDAAGNRPEIYNNQEVALETGSHAGMFIDIGHVFAGLDAFNHRHSVNALGSIEIDNVEGTTWVGDLGSVLAEVIIDQTNSGRGRTDAEWQTRINEYAPAQDMLGNIDAYAIAGSYDIASAEGMKVSDILKQFYLGQGGDTHQNTRYTQFCNGIGLTGWDGSNWTNEQDRLTHYNDQVNDAAAMYVGAGNDSWGTNWVAGNSFAVGLASNPGSRILVEAFFRSLKIARSTEPI